jgi:exosortase/archaeosortase family protein
LIRSAIVGGATLVAYHYSLLTLVRGLSLQTPLAYLGLVPVIALVLVAVRGLTPRRDPDIQDRFVDYVIGLPLLGTALAMLLVLPVHASEYFWLWRLDLLSLPLFVAGAIAVVFGVRVLWHLRYPVTYLLVAWPLPYVRFMTDWMGAFTDGTLAALRLALRLVPVAVPLDSSDGSLFSLVHSGQAFEVSVASACAGVNGLAAFVVVGTAFATIVRGRLLSKLLWLGGGMALIWALNLVRILVIFFVGRTWGEGAAMDGLHPFIGLATFSLGVLAMILALPAFRLSLLSEPAADAPFRSQSRSPARARVAVCAVLVAATVAGAANANLERFASTFYDLGPPRVGGLTDVSASVSGWSLGQTATYPWARPYFGDDSTWIRYQYSWQPGAPNQSAFRAATPVILDVISTSDSNAFATYGLEACYHFHNYRIIDDRTLDLGSGVIAHSLVYYNPKMHADWVAVYWQWPIQSTHGLQYQRVVVNMVDVSQTELTAPPLSPSLASAVGIGITDLLDSPPQALLGLRLTKGRNFLVGFAQQVVASATSRANATAQGANS